MGELTALFSRREYNVPNEADTTPAANATKWVAGKTIPAPSEDDPQATTVERNNALPAKYATHATSGFTLTVGSKATEATFDIAE